MARNIGTASRTVTLELAGVKRFVFDQSNEQKVLAQPLPQRTSAVPLDVMHHVRMRSNGDS